MAQKQFINFKDPVNSLPLAEKDMGLMRPGRYSGFDIGSIVGNTLTIAHSNKIQKLDDSNNLISFGSFKTPKGIIIHDDTPSIVLTIPAGTNYGIVIAEHNYQQIPGGTDANYQLITSSVSFPDIPDPTKQCIIGYVQLVNLTTESGIMVAQPYTPAPAPLPGDGNMADYLESIPYATMSTPGLVRMANLTYQGSDPFNSNTTYINPGQLRRTGVNDIINISTLNSAVSTPGWVTQEITAAFNGEFYKLRDIKEVDIVYEENSGNLKYYRSLKSGVFPIASIVTGVPYPEPIMGYPNLRVDLTNNRAWVIFWSKHDVNINNAQLIINRIK